MSAEIEKHYILEPTAFIGFIPIKHTLASIASILVSEYVLPSMNTYVPDNFKEKKNPRYTF